MNGMFLIVYSRNLGQKFNLFSEKLPHYRTTAILKRPDTKSPLGIKYTFSLYINIFYRKDEIGIIKIYRMSTHIDRITEL